ncbi:hypothetical protein SAMN04489740_2236 [Arthrobacter alpinus]|uniref:Uncharacterized protein n=1 Tax=Arthrobacter alpinus TaxID=656366 RepID=A0A1H5KZE1_9MICC|nr:hypothetical protein [Arthrobacter alpinus]SEE70166.1 hypothetical protein SAMN04489740_2236 [Arthrobacter alpinus]
MPRPHSEIPSQRLAVAQAQNIATSKSQRSIWWTVGITIVGWAVLAYPMILLALLSLVVMTGSMDGTVTASGVALGIVGMLGSLAMLAFPVLLGLAVKVRRRRLWVPALLTGALTTAACIYVTVEWLIPLG